MGYVGCCGCVGGFMGANTWFCFIRVVKVRFAYSGGKVTFIIQCRNVYGMGLDRASDGRFKAKHDVTTDTVLTYLQDGNDMVTSGEIARELGAPRRTVYEYLQSLIDEGLVGYRCPNERLTLYWYND